MNLTGLQIAAGAAHLAKLPEVCAARLPGKGIVIRIMRGEDGYYPAPEIDDPKAWNEEHGVTPQQVVAMQCGSMFGWHVPGADPDHYTEDAAAFQAYGDRKAAGIPIDTRPRKPIRITDVD